MQDIINFINTLQLVELRYMLYLIAREYPGVLIQLEEVKREWELLRSK